MSLDTTKSVKSITYNGTEIPLASTAGAESVSFTIRIKSPIVPGWKIYLTNNTGIQIVESKGTYTVYKNSFILTDGIEAEIAGSSGIQRITRNEGGSLGYFITGDAIFYV